MSDQFLAEVTSLSPSSEITLYLVDLNPAGYNKVFAFTPSDQIGNSIRFGGIEFLARPINITGLEKSSDDAPPEPTLAMGNVDKGGNALLLEYNDLLNAKVTRIVTFEHFLDKLPDGSDNPNKDASATMMPEIWYIEQKVGNTPEQITWKLRSVLDLSDRMIPARLVLKDICTRVYRSWDTRIGAWSYATENACPYAGVAMFDRFGQPTNDPTKDICPHNRSLGCVPRYPNDTLPGWFFPGAARLPRN